MCRFKSTLCRCYTSYFKVSIHPMCRFKTLYGVGADFTQLFQYILCVGSRNSLWIGIIFYLVSIHPMCRFKLQNGNRQRKINLRFNTSYVSVQDFRHIRQYSGRWVSIHPMCRFKKVNTIILTTLSLVSIHPMCRFKLLLVVVMGVKLMVSIHPMCRFKVNINLKKIWFAIKFQYILCVGSSYQFVGISSNEKRFNTSYVSVQGANYLGTSSGYNVSIHPMCRFK